jgi:2-C-methyl-D-erythritol 2,4-cyclodiphosphate synthase
MIRVGIGFDVHRFAESRKLVLGGVEIPHVLGLEGHSDADVVLHAVSDAILGAAGKGDIGEHFPPTDARWKDADSADLLQRSLDIAGVEWKVGNVDIVVMAEEPRISPHKQAMIERISEILAVDRSQVNVKATTTEQLGFVGRREGIAAMATAVLLRVSG